MTQNFRRFALIFATVAVTSVFASTLASADPLVFTPYHKNGIYNLGETVGWTVTLPAGMAVPTTPFRYVATANGATEIKTGTLDLSKGRALLEVAVREPAMIHVVVAGAGPVPVPAASAPASVKASNDARLGAAVAPTKLVPVAERPKDFDAFWAGKLKALDAIPINPVVSPLPTNVAGVELATVALDSVGSHVHGYLAKPSKPGKYPALIIYQWAGVYALQPGMVTSKAAEGWLTLDVDSHDMAPDAATGVPENYQAIGNEDRETSYFLNMYLRDTRALEYIRSRPDWDGKTVVFMGASMGGQQSLVTAGLNPGKVTAVLVNEPAGADFDASMHGRKGGYPNWPSDDAKAMATGLYFDTVNFAPRIKVPVLMAVGFVDETCTPAGVWTAFNQLEGPKEMVPMWESDHNHISPDKQRAYEDRSRQVLATILAGGTFAPDPKRIEPVAP